MTNQGYTDREDGEETKVYSQQRERIRGVEDSTGTREWNPYY